MKSERVKKFCSTALRAGSSLPFIPEKHACMPARNASHSDVGGGRGCNSNKLFHGFACIKGALLAAGIVVLQACSFSGQASTNDLGTVQTGSASKAGSVVEEYVNPGAPIRVDAGRTFSVRIMANPTTGYGWQLSKPLDESVLVLVTNDYVSQPNERRLAGVGGHEVWTFKAVQSGQAEIFLKYVRSWEKDKPPADTNVFTVIVK